MTENDKNSDKIALKLFVWYCNADNAYVEKINTYLNQLKQRYDVEFWDKKVIDPGCDRDEAFVDAICAADIILPIYSPEFIASQEDYEAILPSVLERHHDGSLIIIPIKLSKCDLAATKFGELQAVPSNHFILDRSPHRNGYHSMYEEIRKYIEKFVHERSFAKLEFTPEQFKITMSDKVFSVAQKQDFLIGDLGVLNEIFVKLKKDI